MTDQLKKQLFPFPLPSETQKEPSPEEKEQEREKELRRLRRQVIRLNALLTSRVDDEDVLNEWKEFVEGIGKFIGLTVKPTPARR